MTVCSLTSVLVVGNLAMTLKTKWLCLFKNQVKYLHFSNINRNFAENI